MNISVIKKLDVDFNSNHKKILIAFLVVGSILRIGFSYYHWHYQGLSVAVDQFDYLQYADEISSQGLLVPQPERINAFSAPGFPLYVYLIKSATASNTAVVLVNIILSIFTLLLAYKLADSLFRKNVALLVVIICALYYPFFMYAGFILKETLLYFFILLTVFLLIKSVNIKYLILASLSFVMVFHLDERFLLYIPFFLLAAYWQHRTVKRVVLSSLFVLLFSLPWLVRNYIVYDRIVILTERFQSPLDRVLGYENRLVERSDKFKERLHLVRDRVMSGDTVTLLSSRERSVVEAINLGIVPHDYSLGEKVYYNLMSFWSPIRTKPIFINTGWKFLKERSTLMNIGYASVLLPLILLFLIGIVQAIRQRNATVLFFVCLVIYHTILHVLLISGLGRYRTTIDYFFILVSCWALFNIWKEVKISLFKPA